MNPGKKLVNALSILLVLLPLSVLLAVVAFADGASVYNSNCAGCHRLGTYDTSGSAPDLLGKGSLVDSYYKAGVSGHQGKTLTATNITELKAFLNNPTTPTTPLAISTTTLPGATVGAVYSQTLAASGGTTPYKWSVSSGSLPAGLTLATTGVISGAPTTAATSSFTVKVTDSASTPASATKALSITVAAAGTTTPLSITTSTLPNGTAGTAYSQTLSATGGVPPYTWSYSGTLPTGLGVTSAGSVTGTPTTAGTYSFTARVTDSKATAATRSLSMTIAAAASTPMSASDKNVFITNCASCHTPYGLQNRTAAQVQTAINSNDHGMGTKKLRRLSSTDVNAIARSLVPAAPPTMDCSACHASTTPTPTPTPTPSTGQQIYDSKCASCHSLGTYDATGSAPNLSGAGSLVDSKYTAGVSGHKGITLSATDISNLKTFLNSH